MNDEFLIFIIFGIVFIVSGVIMLVYGKKQKKHWTEVCTLSIQATVIEIRLSGGGENGGHLFTPIYEITYRGKQYIVANYNRYSKNILGLEVGDKTEIHINPENPYDFVDKLSRKWNTTIIGIFLVPGGVLSILIPILF